MLNIWQKIRRLEDFNNCLSLFTPLHDNSDFPSGLQAGFADWSCRAIKVVGDIVQGGLILSFQQLKMTFAITNNDFLKFSQVQNFILTKLKEFTGVFSVSPIESLFAENTQLKFITKWLYKALNSLKSDNSDKVRGRWESDLGTTIEPEVWDALCSKPPVASNSAWERQFKILHGLYISPETRHKFNPDLTEICTKCKSAVGTFFSLCVELPSYAAVLVHNHSAA